MAADDSWIIGLHAVQAALKHEPDAIREVWVDAKRQDARLRSVLAMAEQCGIPVHPEARATLDRLSGNARHQGVLAQRKATRVQQEDDLPAILAAAPEPALLLVLDGVQDPHNLGACLRSADAAGVHAVLAPADRAVGLTPAARKVASGAAETTPFIQVTNLARCLRELQQQGVWLVGAAGEARTRWYEVDLTGPIALVMGAEEKGLRRLTRETCDYLVSIPMAGSVASLNVSVAAGVFLFEARRQRFCNAG